MPEDFPVCPARVVEGYGVCNYPEALPSGSVHTSMSLSISSMISASMMSSSFNFFLSE